MTDDALVLVGHGRYSDSWHDDAAVGFVVAGELAAAGLRPVLRGTFPGSLDDIEPALVVVRCGTGTAADEDADWTGFHGRLAALLAAGVPVLALHQGANTFGSAPWWAAAVGGGWVDGTSWHPPIGTFEFRPVDDEHPVTSGLAPFSAYDEAYLDLVVEPGIRPLVVADHEGKAHPVVWQGPGPARVIYDALGHDGRSFDSPGRRDLLRRELAWLTAGR